MHNRLIDTLPLLQALASPQRLQIMGWLLDPTAHFPPQRDGDLVEDGVCVGFITEKSGLSQPTVSTYMQMLERAGLVRSKRIKNWVFYKARLETLAGLGMQLQAVAKP
jgi:DNA-binding transcriptional ArsR family regulator